MSVIGSVLRRRSAVLAAGGAAVALGLAASPAPFATASTAPHASAHARHGHASYASMPAMFKQGKVTIDLVRELSEGDFFQQFLTGAQSEAKALHIHLDVSSANGSAAGQAVLLTQAIGRHPQGILLDHGQIPTLTPGVKRALANHIPTGAFDVAIAAPGFVDMEQNDREIAQLALRAMQSYLHGHGEVIYAYVAGYTALDTRNGVWEQYKKAHPGIHQVAQIGVVNSNTVTETAAATKAALEANPGVKAVFAPYDAFAQGATLGIQELGRSRTVKVFGADTSTSDIGTMTKTGSPWVASAATDAAKDGAVAVRAMALDIAHELHGTAVSMPPILLTQSALRSRHISSVSQLVKKFPALNKDDRISCVAWMKKIHAC